MRVDKFYAQVVSDLTDDLARYIIAAFEEQSDARRYVVATLSDDQSVPPGFRDVVEAAFGRLLQGGPQSTPGDCRAWFSAGLSCRDGRPIWVSGVADEVVWLWSESRFKEGAQFEAIKRLTAEALATSVLQLERAGRRSALVRAVFDRVVAVAEKAREEGDIFVCYDLMNFFMRTHGRFVRLDWMLAERFATDIVLRTAMADGSFWACFDRFRALLERLSNVGAPGRTLRRTIVEAVIHFLGLLEPDTFKFAMQEFLVLVPDPRREGAKVTYGLMRQAVQGSDVMRAENCDLLLHWFEVLGACESKVDCTLELLNTLQ